MLSDYKGCNRVVVVTPTRHLVRQWELEADSVGLKLTKITANSQLDNGLALDIDGYIVTYQGFTQFADLHESIIAQHKYFAILDEPHHLADNIKSAWGTLTKQGLTSAIARLLLTGTPLRSDGKPIPYVNYAPVIGEPGRFDLVPDFVYSYGQAVTDGICRPVVFIPFDGPVRWRRADVIHEMRFDEKVPAPLESDRLRYATWVDSVNEFLPSLLIAANNKLSEVRRDDADAAALIIAYDIQHARMLESELYRTTGQRATVVLSDDDEALKKIDAFRKGRTPWIIAVRMISEGVDIPRLRVLVYCTNITEELFFIQVMGRIVRGCGAPAFFFMPADGRLLEIAKRIEEEMKLALKAKKEGGGEAGVKTKIEKEFLGAEGEETDHIVAGKEFDAELIETGETLRTVFPDLFANTHPARLAEIARVAKQAQKADEKTKTYDDSKDDKRTKLNILVRRHGKTQNKEYSHLWNDLYAAVGCNSLDDASIDQIERMLDIATKW